MAKKYTRVYDINYNDVDYRLKATISTIMNIFCDIGTRQSNSLGVGLSELIRDNMAWVFYAYDIKVNEYPKYEDRVTVSTEAAGFKKFYAYRNYTIEDESGKVLVEATALFFLIDLTKRRPIRIPKDQYEAYGLNEDLEKLIEMDKITKFEEEFIESDFKVRYSDIDSNRHVNNVKYLEWAIETVPLDIVKDFRLNRVKIVFEKEITYGYTVKSKTKILESGDKNVICAHNWEK